MLVLAFSPWLAGASVDVEVKVAPTVIVTGSRVYSNFPVRTFSENGLFTVVPL